MTQKPDPEETMGKIDLDMDVEPLRRRDDPVADDSGKPNPSSRFADENDEPLFADKTQPVHARSEEPEEAEGAGWGDGGWEDNDDWDEDDDDWGDDEFDEAEAAAEAAAQEEKAHLVGEIRDAVGAVSHIKPEDERRISAPRKISEPQSWEDDEEFGRKALARNHLGGGQNMAEDRLLQETNSQFGDSESSRRRSAMAHLKAAAAATKADRVLKHVVGRDPTADPDEQSPYRDDLAKVVRPRSTSRPISRPVSRPRSQPAEWDQGTSDDDAAMFAAASEESLEENVTSEALDADAAENAERLANAPEDMSADDFADDNFFGDGFSSDYDDDGVEDDIEYHSFDGDDADETISDAADVEEDKIEANGAESDAGVEDEADWSNRFAEDDDEILSEENFAPAGAVDERDDFDAGIEEPVQSAELEGPEDLSDDLSQDDDFDGPVPSSVVSEAVAFANAPLEDETPDEDEIVRRKIAEMSGGNAPAPEASHDTSDDQPIVNVAAAVTGRAGGGRTGGRVKTRLLGFQTPDDETSDVFEAAKTASAANQTQFPVGWIVVIEGPGRGSCFTIFNGVSQIGRGEDQPVRLNFGDNSISRNNHAAIAYDDEQGKFFLGHGGKSNLVRLNGTPVLSTEEMTTGDQIRIGETSLKFVSLCGEDFTWKSTETEGHEAG